MLSLRCCAGFSLVAESGGYPLVAVGGLLIAVSSLVVEYRLKEVPASVVVACELSSCSLSALEFGCSSCGIPA